MAACDRVVLVGWDGFRPDLLTPELTPRLCALAGRGVRFASASAVFPSETRPNNAAIGTGCQPGRHGITANYLRAPDVIRDGLLNTGNHNHLMALAAVPGGPRRVVAPRTLGEQLVESGRRVAFLSSGSPGQAMLQNPSPFAGWTIHRAFHAPNGLMRRVEARFGPMPERTSGEDAGAVDDYLERVAFELVVPELDPQLLVLWSSEPDNTFHYWGVGSPQAEAAIMANDARLGRVLERLDLDRTVVFFISDHGQSTVRERIDLPTELLRGGIRRLARPNDVQVVADGVQLAEPAADLLPRLCAWLREQSWCGPVFVRDDRWSAALAGTAPASVLWGGARGRYVPDVQFSPAWDDEPNEHGVPGRTARIGTQAPRPVSTHGSLNPRDMRNVMLLAGGGVRSGAVAHAPASTADVGPTVLHLLGVDPLPEAQGRPLSEAVDGVEPDAASEVVLEGRWGRLVQRRCAGASYIAVE